MPNIIQVRRVLLKAPAVVLAASQTWNPASIVGGIALSNGDLTATSTIPSGFTNSGLIGTRGQNSGKKIYRFLIQGSAVSYPGLAKSSWDPSTAVTGGDTTTIGLRSNGNIYYGNSGVGECETFANGDAVEIAVDWDVLPVPLAWTRKNAGISWWGEYGWSGSGVDPATGTRGAALTGFVAGTFYPALWFNIPGPACTLDPSGSGAPAGFTAG